MGSVGAAPPVWPAVAARTRPTAGCLYSRGVNGEFNWWLLILGLVIGAGFVWLVLADTRRRESDLAERERESEARWIAEAMRDAGRRISDADALDVLRLHEAYLAAPPPDEPEELDELAPVEPEPVRASLEREPERAPARGRSSAVEARSPMAHPATAADRADSDG